MGKTDDIACTGKQQGFTLLEVAIVVAIVGLLIGGVLKGHLMITNIKLKRTHLWMASPPAMLAQPTRIYRAIS